MKALHFTLVLICTLTFMMIIFLVVWYMMPYMPEDYLINLTKTHNLHTNSNHIFLMKP